MKSKKKNLIEALHGSFMFIDNLPDLISKETIYDENGYVDLEFLTAILNWMSRMADVSTKIHLALNTLLGVEEDTTKKQKDDKGKIWDVGEILRHCTLENNVLKLPNVQFNKKSYAEAKKWIEEAGGSWQGGKVQGFTFPFNADRVFSILKEGKRCDLQKDFQFFETPAELADWLVMLAGGVSNTDRILEPSAGRGALIKAIHRAEPSVEVFCYELMPENREFLQSINNVTLLGEDFTKEKSTVTYDKIIANPPFTGNQDIDHVQLMYDLLSKGGTLAAITSIHWRIGNEQKCVKFREWLEKVGGNVVKIESGTFKESGTATDTVAIVIKKME